ncbi:FecR domain-containing protein [Candidatus Omnitrophota bacterium]
MRSGKILDMDGKVVVWPVGGDRVIGERGMELHEGDVVETKSDAFALIKLYGIEEATVELNPNSQMLLSELTMDKEKGTQKTLLDLALGKILIKAEKLHSGKSKFEVKTPTSVVGVRGTTFAVEVEAME